MNNTKFSLCQTHAGPTRVVPLPCGASLLLIHTKKNIFQNQKQGIKGYSKSLFMHLLVLEILTHRHFSTSFKDIRICFKELLEAQLLYN